MQFLQERAAKKLEWAVVKKIPKAAMRNLPFQGTYRMETSEEQNKAAFCRDCKKEETLGLIKIS